MLETHKGHRKCIHSRMLQGALGGVSTKSELYSKYPFFKEHVEQCRECRKVLTTFIDFYTWKQEIIHSRSLGQVKFQELEKRLKHIIQEYAAREEEIDRESVYEKLYTFSSRFFSEILSPTALLFYLCIGIFLLICYF